MHRYLLTTFLLALAAGPASGQLVPTSPLVFTSRDDSGLYSEDLSTAFAATDDLADGYNLHVQGHASLTFQPGEQLGALFGPVLESIIVARQFQVGPVPVEVTPTILSDGKIVISGDPNAPVEGSVQARARVHESGAVDLNADPLEFATFSDLGPSLYNDTANATRSGNGVTFLPSEPANNDTFVLAPGANYTLLLNITTLLLDGRPLDAGDPVTKLTYEFGGDSSAFDGITLDLNARMVPEPAAAATLGLAGLGLLARRRRA